MALTIDIYSSVGSDWRAAWGVLREAEWSPDLSSDAFNCWYNHVCQICVFNQKAHVCELPSTSRISINKQLGSIWTRTSIDTMRVKHQWVSSPSHPHYAPSHYLHIFYGRIIWVAMVSIFSLHE